MEIDTVTSIDVLWMGESGTQHAEARAAFCQWQLGQRDKWTDHFVKFKTDWVMSWLMVSDDEVLPPQPFVLEVFFLYFNEANLGKCLFGAKCVVYRILQAQYCYCPFDTGNVFSYKSLSLWWGKMEFVQSIFFATGYVTYATFLPNVLLMLYICDFFYWTNISIFTLTL